MTADLGPEPAGRPDLEIPERKRHRPIPAGVALLVAIVVLGGGAVSAMLAGALTMALLFGLSALLFGSGVAATALLGTRLVAVTVRGASMEPSYHDGDRVLVRRHRTLVPGQVVVVERPGQDTGRGRPPPASEAIASREWLIKRVAAVPGDPVPGDRVPALASVPEHVVPSGKLVLLGDNEEASYDSRFMGYFPVERVLGAVVRTLPTSS